MYIFQKFVYRIFWVKHTISCKLCVFFWIVCIFCKNYSTKNVEQFLFLFFNKHFSLVEQMFWERFAWALCVQWIPRKMYDNKGADKRTALFLRKKCRVFFQIRFSEFQLSSFLHFSLWEFLFLLNFWEHRVP